jgi:diacylglycerol kinase (ATP)
VTPTSLVARVVVNPDARRSASLPRIDLGWPWRTIIEHADSKEAAIAIVRDSIRQGEVVVVAGGDGSLHTAINAIADRAGRVGLLPLGTANDFARDVGLPMDPMAAAWRIADGQARSIDVLTINGRRCVVGGGFGLPGFCIDTVHALRHGSSTTKQLVRLGGGRVYQAAAIRHVFPTPPHIHVHVRWTTPEGVEHAWDTAVIAAFFLNQPTIGRGLLLAPGASRTDGVFELSFILPSSAMKLLTGLRRVSQGRAAPGQVVVVRAVAAHLELRTPIMVFADGEPQETTRVIDVGVLPGALTFIS